MRNFQGFLSFIMLINVMLIKNGCIWSDPVLPLVVFIFYEFLLFILNNCLNSNGEMQYLTLNYPILGAAHSVIKVRIKFVSEHFKLMMLMKDPFEIDFFRCKKLENIFPILN